MIDQTIGIARSGGEPLSLRLVAFRKPEAAIAVARVKTRREATKEGLSVIGDTLVPPSGSSLSRRSMPRIFRPRRSGRPIGRADGSRWLSNA